MKLLITCSLLALIGCASQIKQDANEVKPLKTGDVINNVEIKNIQGENVKTQMLFKEKPTVLVVYRGGWCPYCNKQLSRLRKVTKKIEAKGYQLIAVSPDKPESMQASIKKNKIKEYELYSDSKLNLAKALGLAFKVNEQTKEKYKEYGIDLVKASGETHYSLPVPAVYIVDKDGKIKFRFYEADYKVRLEEKELLKQL